MTDTSIPSWARGSISVTAASPLQHVNRYYWIYMRHLNCLLANAGGIRGRAHYEAVIRIIDAEKRNATEEFRRWKRDNGHD